jgi:SAM-dependent methyltransferase
VHNDRPVPPDGSPRLVVVTEQGRKVADHWAQVAVTFEGAIRSLRARGIAPENVRAENLHAVDMIHMGGLAATDALASMAGIAEGEWVLDVGSGVGGPARRMADRFGAIVCAVELSEVLHDTGLRLTELVGMTELIRFVQGSALALPVHADSVDVTVMQHVAMQIAEKDALFGELVRVLRPGGRLALHEIFAGQGQIEYPLPWATEPGMSALEALPACIGRLTALGCEVGEFADRGEEGLRFHRESLAAYNKAGAAERLGLTEAAMDARRAASAAMERNLDAGSIKVGMLIARKTRPAQPA